jgi:hypothetical protein
LREFDLACPSKVSVEERGRRLNKKTRPGPASGHLLPDFSFTTAPPLAMIRDMDVTPEMA